MPTKSSIPFRILSAPSESIKPLISVPNKRQTERALVPTTRHLCLRLRAQLSGVVDLRDLVDREVLCVNVALQFGFEGGADLAEPVPLDAVEEWVTLDVCCAVGATEAVGGIGDKTGYQISREQGWLCGRDRLPSNKVFSFRPKLLVRRKVEVTLPIDDLAVRIMWLLCAERRPADKTFKHDSTNAPPIAAEIVALAREDLRCDVVWCANGGVRELTPRFAPGVDLVAVGDGKLNLVD
jgi:hypothetical protein